MNKNKIAAKLRGREFEIEGIDDNGIHCKQKAIRLKNRSQVEILITSCKIPENNMTCLARVEQKTHTTVFKPIFEDNKKLLPVKNSGIVILHSTFYDNNFIGKNYIYCGGDTQETTKKKKQKIAAYRIGDEDGNFYFQPDNSFSLLDRVVVRNCVSKLVGKEITVSAANSMSRKSSELDILIPRSLRTDIGNLLETLEQSFPLWTYMPEQKYKGSNTAVLKFKTKGSFWEKHFDSDNNSFYVHKISHQKTYTQPTILKWKNVWATERGNSDDKASQYCYNTDDRFNIDKIEVLQSDVDVDGMIRDLGRSRVSDKGRMKKTERILKKIKKLISERKYYSTTSFNNDIGNLQESLDGWQSPLNEDDIISLSRKCCFVRYTCNNSRITHRITQIMNNTNASTFGVLIMPKENGRGMYIKVRKPVLTSNTIYFDYYNPRSGIETAPTPTNLVFSFNYAKSKPEDEYATDLPGYFNSVDKKRARGLRHLRNQLKADVKQKKITFFDVKNYISELKENAIEYYKTVEGGMMQKNSVNKLWSEFLPEFKKILSKYHARSDGE